MRDTYFAGADFSFFRRGLRIPARAGCLGFYLFGQDAYQSSKNYAGGPDGVIVGDPEFHDGYMTTISGVAHLDTLFNESIPITMMSVFRPGTGGGTIRWAGSNVGDAPPEAPNTYNGFGLRVRTSDNTSAVACGTVENGQDVFRTNSLQETDVSTFAFRSAKRDSSGRRQLRNLTAGLNTGPLAALTPRVNANRTILVGSSWVDPVGIRVDSAFFALWSRFVSDAEEEDTYGMIQEQLARLSTPIPI